MNNVYKNAFLSNGRSFVGLLLFLFSGLFATAQNTSGDYRTAATNASWNTPSDWQVWNGSSWTTAATAPGATNNVYVQSGHTVTLSSDASCLSLYISTGTTGATTGSDAKVALTDFALNINGKLSCYFGPLDVANNSTTPLTVTASNTIPATPITKTANSNTGRIRFVTGNGADHVLVANGEWGAGNTASTSTFDVEVNLNSGQTGSIGANVKAYNWYVTSGTLDALSTATLSSDNGTTGGNVTVSTGATLSSAASTIIQRTGSASAGTLTVNGTLRVSALNPALAVSVINFNGTVEYSRSSAQNFIVAANSGANPDTYTNIVLSGGGAKTISASLPISLYGALTISGTASLVTNSSLTLKSTASNTARVAPITSTAGTPISGSVTAERFISSQNNRAYRLLAPIVTTPGSIRDNWQEGGNNTSTNAASNVDLRPGYGTHITGSTTGANGFDATVTGQVSLFSYNQVATSQVWVPFNNTDVTTLNAKTGYLIFIRGDRRASNLYSNTSSNTTLEATGALLTGDQTFTNLESNGRFSLVTNPFASPISWTSIYNNSSNNTNFEKFYYYWDPNVGSTSPNHQFGAFVTVDNTGAKSNAASLATVEIQSGQAFFVLSKSGTSSPTFTVRETDKSTTNNIDVFRVGKPESFSISLYYKDDTGSRRISDGALVQFDNNYSAAVDGNDAPKFPNFYENIAIARDGKMLSIEGRPLVEANDNIPLSIGGLKQQQYEWQFDPSDFNAPNLQAYLQDKFLNTKTPISLSNTTVIPFTVTTDAASSAADRFTIVFSPASTLPVTMSTVKAYQKASGIQVEWSSVTENNVDRYEVERSINGQQFAKVGTVASTGNSSSLKAYSWFDPSPNAGSNYYRIRSVSKAGSAEFTSIVRVALTDNAQSISVYPNPIHGDVVGLQFTNLAKGTYTITITNKLGQQVYSKVIEHRGGSASQTLQTATFAKGIYQLQLSGESTTITTQLVKQ
jgi:hypothetical protein